MDSQAKELEREPSFRNRVRHPPCIRHLLRRGVPPDMGWDMGCILLARYLVTKGLNDVQGTKMAKAMLKHSEALSDGAQGGREFKQFVATLSQARDNPKMNLWHCEDVWSSKELCKRGVCTAWSCEYYRSASFDKSEHRNDEKEICAEGEALTYLLNNPDSIIQAPAMDLRSEGFIDEYKCNDGTRIPFNRILWHICRYLAHHGRPIQFTTILASLSKSPPMRPHLDELERYLKRLQSYSSCHRDRFIEYVQVIGAGGGRMRAQDLVGQAAIALTSSVLPLDVILNTLEHQSRILASTACDKNHLLEQDINDFVANLFSNKRSVIPTRSDWLNVCLDGGWKAGKAYVLIASSAAEATDFCAWCAEFAAQRRFPTVMISGGISKDDFTEKALSRHCSVDTMEIQAYRKHSICDVDATILERLVEAGEGLSRRVASYLVVIEAHSDMTVSDIRRTVRTAQDRTGADRDLPTLLILDQLPPQDFDSGKLMESIRKNVYSKEHLPIRSSKFEMCDSAVAIIAGFSKAGIANQTQAEKEEANAALSQEYFGQWSVADYVLTIESKPIRVRGTTLEKEVNQLNISREWYTRSYPRFRAHVDRLFDEAEDEYPLDKATSRYARISLLGKGGKTRANPVIIYEWPYHRFRTLDIEPTGLETCADSAFDEDSGL